MTVDSGDREDDMEGTLLATAWKTLESVGVGLWKFITRRPVVPRRTLRFVPEERDCWWYLGSVKDEPAMQIVGRWYATNISDAPVHIVRVRIVKPRLAGTILVRHPEQDIYGSYPILAGRMSEVSTDFWMHPSIQQEGDDLVVRIEFTDNFGNRHRTKKVTFKSQPRGKAKKPDVSLEPVYSISDPIVKKVASVLKAEVVRYQNCGRRVGGLGSVETHYGEQTLRGVGSDWRQADSPRQQEIITDAVQDAIRSDNAAALLAVFAACAKPEEKETFVNALIDRISRDSEYASVSYLIALVLFRVDRLADGLIKAKADLLGDKQYGFSDMLRIIDGLLRFEHSSFTDELLDDIERTLHGIEEQPFRIPQRIAAIRAHRLVPGERPEGSTVQQPDTDDAP